MSSNSSFEILDDSSSTSSLELKSIGSESDTEHRESGAVVVSAVDRMEEFLKDAINSVTVSQADIERVEEQAGASVSATKADTVDGISVAAAAQCFTPAEHAHTENKENEDDNDESNISLASVDSAEVMLEDFEFKANGSMSQSTVEATAIKEALAKVFESIGQISSESRQHQNETEATRRKYREELDACHQEIKQLIRANNQLADDSLRNRENLNEQKAANIELRDELEKIKNKTLSDIEELKREFVPQWELKQEINVLRKSVADLKKEMNELKEKDKLESDETNLALEASCATQEILSINSQIAAHKTTFDKIQAEWAALKMELAEERILRERSAKRDKQLGQFLLKIKTQNNATIELLKAKLS